VQAVVSPGGHRRERVSIHRPRRPHPVRRG